MAKDVIITPASGLIDFKNASGVSVSTIQLADNGNFSVGNTASNLYIGDGTNSVDIIFEQNGKVRALTGKTLTLGQTDSTVNLNAPLTYTSPDGTKTVTTSMLNSGTLSISGSAGQLFSVNNSFTGTTFSVNDVSGIPSIEVLDTGVVKLAQYGGNVLLGTGVDDGINKVQVNGFIKATAFGINGISGTGEGISLYNGMSSIVNNMPTWGISFAQTPTFGTHGAVSGSWATYFTMDTTAGRGWIFKQTGGSNVASISNDGKITANIYYGNLGNGAANRIVYQTATDTTSFIAAPTTASTFLQWNGSAFAWAGGGNVTANTSVTGMVKIFNGALANAVPGTDYMASVAPGANNNILTSNGTSWVSTTSTAASTGKAIAFALVMGF